MDSVIGDAKRELLDEMNKLIVMFTGRTKKKLEEAYNRIRNTLLRLIDYHKWFEEYREIFKGISDKQKISAFE